MFVMAVEIEHEEWRSFDSPVTHLPDYHAFPGCVVARWPSFVASCLVTPMSIASKLHPVHKSFIAQFFRIHL